MSCLSKHLNAMVEQGRLAPADREALMRAAREARRGGVPWAEAQVRAIDARLESLRGERARRLAPEVSKPASTPDSILAELEASRYLRDARKLMAAGLLRILHSSEAPASVPQGVAAFFEPRRRRATLLYDRVAPGQAAGRFAHELGHDWLRDMAGAEFEGLVAEFERLLREGDPWAARAAERAEGAGQAAWRLAQEAQRRLARERTEANRAAYQEARAQWASERTARDEERLAYLLEEYANTEAAARAGKFGERMLALLRRVMAAIRAWFRQTPFYQAMQAKGYTMPLSAHDIAHLARAAVRARARQAERSGGSALQAEPSRTGIRASHAPVGNTQPIPEVRDAEGRLLAPNGKPSKLNEGQWKQVRTPEFKAWFGDWEALAHRRFLEGAPVATLSGQEFSDRTRAVQDMVAEFFAERGGQATHPELGDIVMNRRSVKDSSAHGGMRREKIAAFAAVPEVLASGRVIARERQWKGRPYDGFTLAAPVRIGNRDTVVVAVVRRDANTQRFYLHDVALKQELQQAALRTGASSAMDGAPTGAAAGANVRLLLNIFSVNPDSVSKLVDENGEPWVVYHGTNADISVFRYLPGRDAGFHLGTLDAAHDRLGKVGDVGQNVMPVFLNLRNPLDMGDAGRWNNHYDLREPLAQAGLPITQVREFFKRIDALENRLIDEGQLDDEGVIARVQQEAGLELQALLERNGYDGIRYANQYEGQGSTSYAAFRPDQIKSATGNTGAFGQRAPTAEEAGRFGMTRDEAREAQNQGDIRFSRDAEAGIGRLVQAQSRGEFTRMLREADDATARLALKWITRDQLAEVSHELLPEIQDRYLRIARELDGDRNELQERAGRFLEPWGNMARQGKTRPDAARLSNLMHEATMAGVDPDVPYQPIIGLREGLEQLRKIRSRAVSNKAMTENDVGEMADIKRRLKQEMARRREYGRIKALWDELGAKYRTKFPAEASRAAVLEAQDRLTEAEQKELAELRETLERPYRIYRETRDFHAHVADETLKALEARIQETDAPGQVKRELIAKLRQEFESGRVAAPYFPLFRAGDYWISYRAPDVEVQDTAARIERLEGGRFVVTMRPGSPWPAALDRIAGNFHKGLGKVFDPRQEERVRAALGALLRPSTFRNPGERFFELFETRADRDESLEQLEREGMTVLGAGQRLENYRELEGVPARFVAEVETLLGELPDTPGTRGVKDGVWQLYLHTLPEQSMRRHALHRTKRKGYLEDALRANAHKAFHDAHQLARLRHMPKLSGVIDGLRADIEAASSGEKRKALRRDLERWREYQAFLSVPGNDLRELDRRLAELNLKRDREGGSKALNREIARFEQFRQWFKTRFRPAGQIATAEARLAAAERIRSGGLADIDRAARYLGELQDFHALLANPQSSRWAQAFNTLGFAWFLGGSVGAGVLNMLQTPLVAMPFAGAKFGARNATRAFARALGEFFSTPKLTLGAVLEGDELAAFHDFQRLGLIDKTLSHDVAGLSERGVDYSDFRFRAMKFLAAAFHHTERWNREVTAMAVYRMVRAHKHLGHEEAFWETVRFTDRVHGNYEAANRAAVLRGPTARVLTQFKQYSQFMTYLLLRTFNQAFKGATPEVRKEAGKALAGTLTAVTMAAGVSGLPWSLFAVAGPAAVWGKKGLALSGVGYAAAALASMALNDPDEPDDWEAELRTWLTRTAAGMARGLGFEEPTADQIGRAFEHLIYKGAIDASGDFARLAAGEDSAVAHYWPAWAVADRIGLGELWVREPDRDLEGERAYLRWLETFGGPPLGISKNVFMGSELIAKGLNEHNPAKTVRGIEQMLPTLAKSLAKAGRFLAEGARTLDGAELVPDVTPGEILGQAIGFQPARVASRQELNAAIRNREGALQERRSALKSRLTRAIQDRDVDFLCLIDQIVTCPQVLDGHGRRALGLKPWRRLSAATPTLPLGAPIKTKTQGSAWRSSRR